VLDILVSLREARTRASQEGHLVLRPCPSVYALPIQFVFTRFLVFLEVQEIERIL
jgi:hypothetical protein